MILRGREVEQDLFLQRRLTNKRLKRTEPHELEYVTLPRPEQVYLYYEMFTLFDSLNPSFLVRYLGRTRNLLQSRSSLDHEVRFSRERPEPAPLGGALFTTGVYPSRPHSAVDSNVAL